MIRLRIEGPDDTVQETEFLGQTVTIGRASDNQLVLSNRSVSKHHGRLSVDQGHYLYTDMGSSNGTIVLQNGQALVITGKQVRGQSIEPGATLRIGPYRVCLEHEAPVFSPSKVTDGYQVHQSIQLRRGHGRSFLPPPRVSEQFIEFIQLARTTLDDEKRLVSVFRDFIFRVFPQATHLFVLTTDPRHGHLHPVLRTSRRHRNSDSTVSRTLVHRVIQNDIALLCRRDDQPLGLESIANIGIEGAICAPLRGTLGNFGALQVDIRGISNGAFAQDDLELLALIADFVGMVFEGQRAAAQEHHRFRMCVRAILLAIEPYEPERLAHSKEKSKWIQVLAHRLRLHPSETRELRYGALLSALSPPVLAGLAYPPSLQNLPKIMQAASENGRDDRTEIEMPSMPESLLAADLLMVAGKLTERGLNALLDDTESLSPAQFQSISAEFGPRLAAHLACLAIAFDPGASSEGISKAA